MSTRMISIPIALILVTAAPEPFHVAVRAGASWGATNAADPAGELEQMGAFSVELETALSDWTLGLGADLGATMFGHEELTLGAHFGRRFEVERWFIPELGLEAGAHHWWRLGDGLLNDATGDTTALLPYVGARAAIHFRIPIRSSGLLFSLYGRARTDLRITRATPEITSVFGGGVRETIAVGGQTVQGGLMLGLEI